MKQILKKEEYRQYLRELNTSNESFLKSKEDFINPMKIIELYKTEIKRYQWEKSAKLFLYDEKKGVGTISEELSNQYKKIDPASPEKVNTLYDGGNVLYCMENILNYYKHLGIIKDVPTVEELAEIAIDYDCRRNGAGTIWLFFDRLIPRCFNLSTTMIQDVNDIIPSLEQGPILIKLDKEIEFRQTKITKKMLVVLYAVNISECTIYPVSYTHLKQKEEPEQDKKEEAEA